MRSYAQIVPTFWTRGSGRKLRGHPNAQVLALYLMTSPSSNLIGLYYQPLTTICHETGLTAEQVREEMPKLSEMARYDFDAEVVWLPECARYQIGEVMVVGDKRRNAVEREVSMFQGHEFANEFLARYGASFGLRVRSETKPLIAAADAPSKPPVLVLAPVIDPEPDPESLQARSARVVSANESGDSMTVSLAAPHTWPEVAAVASELGRALGMAKPKLGAFYRDSGVRAIVCAFADGRSLEDMLVAARAAGVDDYCIKNRKRGAALLTPAVINALLPGSASSVDETGGYGKASDWK